MTGKLSLILIFSLALSACPVDCGADTFTNRKTGQVYHGYATSTVIEGKRIVQTTESGQLSLNLAEYKIKQNAKGRNNTVAILKIPDAIELEIETEAFAQAITEAADAGPLFILIEIDTPGGRLDLAKKLCAAITETKNCRKIAFIKGGRFGGAYSAGVAVSLACDKIYMAPGTIIGAATVITYDESGKPTDLKKALGEIVAEKTSSGWRNYLATLAQQNNRPGLLAKAMVNKDIEVLEVSRYGEILFVEPVNKKTNHRVVRTWSKEGSLLTLPAKDAIKCGMADKLIGSRGELLNDNRAASAKLIIDTKTDEARALFKKINLRYEKLSASLDSALTQIQLTRSRPKVLKLLNTIRSRTRKIMLLHRRYPDVPIDPDSLQELLNTAEAYYEGIRASR